MPQKALQCHRADTQSGVEQKMSPPENCSYRIPLLLDARRTSVLSPGVQGDADLETARQIVQSFIESKLKSQSEFKRQRKDTQSR